MADIVDTATRSRMMSAIRAVNTKPEHIIRKLLHGLGFRYRIHVAGLAGRPDIVLPRHRAVILVHGCFWHGHDCTLFKLPRSREAFWLKKIITNQMNDVITTERLHAAGWRVGTIWECALRGKTRVEHPQLGLRLSKWILGRKSNFEIRGFDSEKK